MTRREWKRSIPAWLRATAIGAPFGCIPAGGTEIPTFLSYAVEKKLAKGSDREEFGTVGAIEGVAGPEAANNATVTTALIPLLTLGLPTSNTTAILLGAFQNYGIQPGPQLFTTSAALVWALIASLYIGNVMLLVLNLPLVKLWVQAAEDPEAAAVRRHPDLRDGGRLRHAAERLRPGAAVRHRPGGRGDAPLRLPDRAGGGRHDPRARWPRRSCATRCPSAKGAGRSSCDVTPAGRLGVGEPARDHRRRAGAAAPAAP